MANTLLRKRTNKLLTGRNNYFTYGSVLPNNYLVDASLLVGIPGTYAGLKIADSNFNKTRDMYNQYSGLNNTTLSTEGVNNASKFGPWAAAAAMIGSDVADFINKALGKDIKDAANNMIGSIKGQMLGAVTGDTFEAAINDLVNRTNIGHVTARDMGKKNFGEMLTENLSGGKVLGSLFGNILRNGIAEDQANRVNKVIDYVNDFNDRSFSNRIGNLVSLQSSALNANYAALGGQLFNQHGGYFSNGLQYINSGGRHEENPHEGVLMGIDPLGVPNLVEEGEVVFNDYVFSNRLKVPRGMRTKYKFGGKKNTTFADFAEFLGKESEERPFDPISKNGLFAFMGDLANALEQVRPKEPDEQMGVEAMYAANGGKLGNWFSTKGQMDNSTVSSYPGGNRAAVPYDWKNFVYNGIQLFNPDTKLYSGLYLNDDFKKFIRDNYDTLVKEWWNNEENTVNWSKSNKGKIPTLEQLLGDDKKVGLMYDGPTNRYGLAYSDAHNFGLWMLNQYMNTPNAEGKKPADEIKYAHKVLGANPDETPSDFPAPYEYFPGNKNGYVWDKYVTDVGGYTQQGMPVYDPESKTVTTYYNAPAKKKSTTRKYYDTEGNLVFKGTADEAAEKNIDFTLYGDAAATLEDGTQIYREQKKPKFIPYKQDWKDQGWWSLIADATGLGLTAANKPNYRGIEAMVDAAKGYSSNPPMIRADHLGDYLTYDPENIDYEVNKANQTHLAGLRALMNTSGGNRAAAQAGILAADMNALNNQGQLYHDVFKANREHKKDVSTFNRETNQFNITNDLTADKSNQDARLRGIDAYLNAMYNSENLKYRARSDWEAGVGAGIDRISRTANNMARQRTNIAMLNNLLASDIAPGYIKDWQAMQTLSKGGRIKRKKKGLTY